MATISEIKRALKILKKNDIILLHCVSDYPTNLKDMNLKFMTKLKKIFNLTIGLSDHSPGFLSPVIATSLGAKVIEKHVTLNKNYYGPDHKTSITINEFSKMVNLIRQTELILGQNKKIISKGEQSNKRAVRKSCVASKNIFKGERILKESICFKRPGTGVSPLLVSKFINKKSKKFIKQDTILKLKNFR